MPVLRAVLGHTVPAALARTAVLARADAEYLDAQAGLALDAVLLAPAHAPIPADPGGPPGRVSAIDLAALRALPAPLRTRALRLAVGRLGAPAPDFERLAALDALVSGSKSAGPIQLEGPVYATRVAGPRLLPGNVAHLRLDATAAARLRA